MPKLPTIPEALAPFVTVIATAFVFAVFYSAAPGPLILAIVTTGLAVLTMSARTLRGPGRSSRPRRRTNGWNVLGTIDVRSADPFLTFRAERSEEGLSVPVAAGQWTVHGRSTPGSSDRPGTRDVEVRVVRDVRWAMLDWDWSPMQEPILPESLGSSTQVGRIGLDTGTLRVHPGRKDKPRAAVRVEATTTEGSVGVGVVRDPEGEVVAVVSRLA